MKRRQFLTGSAAGLFAACRTAAAEGAEEAKRARIAVSSYPFYNRFEATRDKKLPPPEKPLTFLDFPELIADSFHLHKLEILSPHFESRDASYTKEVNRQLKRAHSQIVNIPIDISELWNQDGLSAADPKTAGAGNRSLRAMDRFRARRGSALGALRPRQDQPRRPRAHARFLSNARRLREIQGTVRDYRESLRRRLRTPGRTRTDSDAGRRESRRHCLTSATFRTK